MPATTVQSHSSFARTLPSGPPAVWTNATALKPARGLTNVVAQDTGPLSFWNLC